MHIWYTLYIIEGLLIKEVIFLWMFKIQEEELVNYIKEISSGNETALRDFYDEYGRKILTLILSIVKSKETAEEVLQDVLMAIVTHRNDKSIVNARAWLFKVIKNVSHKKLKGDQLSQSEALSEYEEILLIDDISEEIENSPDQIEALKHLDQLVYWHIDN